MKLTRDPVTGYAAVEIAQQLVILKKGVTAEEIKGRPIHEIVETTLGPSERKRPTPV